MFNLNLKNMLLQYVSISESVVNYSLIERVFKKGHHYPSGTGDYGYYLYRRKPFFYVRKKHCSSQFSSCYWYTIKKDKIERFPSGFRILEFFLSCKEIKYLINELK